VNWAIAKKRTSKGTRLRELSLYEGERETSGQGLKKIQSASPLRKLRLWEKVLGSRRYAGEGRAGNNRLTFTARTDGPMQRGKVGIEPTDWGLCHLAKAEQTLNRGKIKKSKRPQGACSIEGLARER